MADLIQKTDTLNEGRGKLNTAITDAEKAKTDASTAKSTANQAKAMSESTQTQLDQIVIEGDSSVEAAQARIDVDGQAHSTLKARLDAEQTAVASQLAETSKDIKESVVQLDVEPHLIDMHYGVLKGVGWQNETPTLTEYAVSQKSTKNSKVIYCNGVNTVFKVGQLICYTDKNGDYHSNVVTALTTTQISVAHPLHEDLDTTSKVMSFYTNYSHPNKYGYRTIADFALKSYETPSGKMIARLLPTDWKALNANTTFANVRGNNYFQPYGKTDANQITITTQNSGAKQQIDIYSPGIIKIKLPIETIFDNEVKMVLEKEDGTEMFSSTINNDKYVKPLEITLSLSVGTYFLKIISIKSTGIVNAYVGVTEVYNCDKKYNLTNLNRGTHLLLGDSWFEQEGILQRFQEKLPLATFINFGVGGNTAEQITRRFIGTATDADIKNDPAKYGDRKDATSIPHIDYVWIMCSTNDYYANKTVTQFQNEIKQLVDYVIARGAKPILFNASVGDINKTATTYNILDLSRQYTDFYFNVHDSIASLKGDMDTRFSTLAKRYLINFANVDIAIGEKFLGSCGIVKATEKVIIEEIGFDYSTNKNIKIVYDSNIDAIAPYDKEQTISTAFTLSEIDFGSPTNNRWFSVVAYNNTGSNVKYNGYVRLRVEPI